MKPLAISLTVKLAAILVLIVLTACTAFAKDHSSAYQVGIFRASEAVSDGTYSSASCGTLGCSGSAYSASHNVHYVQTQEGTYTIEAPVSVGGSMLLAMATPGGNSPTVHKAWFMDQLSDGVQVLFAVGCNKHNHCTFWLPNPDKVGKEIETQGWFQPLVARSNTTSLCGTGKLTPEVERQVCQQETSASACPCVGHNDNSTCRSNWHTQCGGQESAPIPQSQAPPPPTPAPAPVIEPQTPPQQSTSAPVVMVSIANKPEESGQHQAVPQPVESGATTPQLELAAQQTQTLRQAILKDSNAGFQKANVLGYVEIAGDNIVVHSPTTAEKVSTYLTSSQFEQQLLPTLRQAGLAMLTYTNDSGLVFLYDVNAGRPVQETVSK
jgi:hypothetical protein